MKAPGAWPRLEAPTLALVRLVDGALQAGRLLVDTSVWINHFRRSNPDLEKLLEGGHVLTHPFIIGELACGSLGRRAEVLRLIRALPEAPVAAHEEVMTLLDSQHLHGTGLGWIDVHLLASALLIWQPLWSADRQLKDAAVRLGLTR